MKISHLCIALFSLGLVSVSCGKKKKEEKPAIPATEQPAEHGDHHGHDHGDHEGHDH